MYVYEEITSQGRAWADLIPLVTRHTNSILEIFNGIEEVIFTGCGSGLNAAFSGAPAFQALTGIPTRAVPAAETYLFPKSVLNRGRKILVVLLSRSGKTTEVVQALESLRGMGVRTIGVTCTQESPLASGSDVALVLLPVEERAVATTRSLSGMILALQLMAAILGEEQAYLDELHALPQICKALMPDFEDLGRRIGQRLDVERYAFVGNGPFYGIARECQLKVKEMALLPVDAYPLFDFRHGPQSNVNERMLVTAFISDSARAGEIQFLEDMKAFGGLTWAICDRACEGLQVDYILELNSGISQFARLPLYLPAVQFMAYYRALSQGLNPDQPRQLSYWVDTTR
jgi:glucosamine--fructose-6-phosphate aminotransferase (isomerizing)